MRPRFSSLTSQKWNTGRKRFRHFLTAGYYWNMGTKWDTPGPQRRRQRIGSIFDRVFGIEGLHQFRALTHPVDGLHELNIVTQFYATRWVCRVYTAGDKRESCDGPKVEKFGGGIFAYLSSIFRDKSPETPGSVPKYFCPPLAHSCQSSGKPVGKCTQKKAIIWQ